MRKCQKNIIKVVSNKCTLTKIDCRKPSGKRMSKEVDKIYFRERKGECLSRSGKLHNWIGITPRICIRMLLVGKLD